MFQSRNFCYWLAIFMGLVVILKVMQSFLIPATFAIMLVFMTSPAYRFMTLRKIPPIMAITLLMILISAFVYLIFTLIQASLWSIIRVMPKYQATFRELWHYIFDRLNLSDSDGTFIYAGQLTDALYGILIGFSNQFLSILSSVLVVFLFYIFLMSEIALFRRKISCAYSDAYEKIVDVVSDIGVQIGDYLALKFFISLLTGIFTTLFLLLVKVDFAFVWGGIVFIFNFVPNIGSIVAVFSISLFSLLQYFPDFHTPIFTCCGCTAIQLILGNIVEPKMQGDRLNISPFLLLFFFFFWAWLWGVSGMFLAYPLTVVMKVTFQSIPPLQPFAILLGSGVRNAKEQGERG